LWVSVMEKKQQKCSGSLCPMQHGEINVDECECTDTCPYYMPITDFGGMEAVIDMAIKQFSLESDSDKRKLKILLNAYVSEYIATCFQHGGI